MSEFDLDGFIGETSERLRVKNRRPPVDSFARALEREARDANARDRIARGSRPALPVRGNPDGSDGPPAVVLPQERRTR